MLPDCTPEISSQLAPVPCDHLESQFAAPQRVLGTPVLGGFTCLSGSLNVRWWEIAVPSSILLNRRLQLCI